MTEVTAVIVCPGCWKTVTFDGELPGEVNGSSLKTAISVSAILWRIKMFPWNEFFSQITNKIIPKKEYLKTQKLQKNNADATIYN